MSKVVPLLEGAVSGIFSNNLKFQKSHLHQWKPINNGQVLLKVTMLIWFEAISKSECF